MGWARASELHTAATSVSLQPSLFFFFFFRGAGRAGWASGGRRGRRRRRQGPGALHMLLQPSLEMFLQGPLPSLHVL